MVNLFDALKSVRCRKVVPLYEALVALHMDLEHSIVLLANLLVGVRSLNPHIDRYSVEVFYI